MSAPTQQTRRCPILVNHRAGALRVTAGANEIRRLAEAAGLHADVVSTHSPEHLRSLVRQFMNDGAEQIAVAGGDGTVALAVQELACTKTALGILPQGTANNFATALRLPQDLPSAVRVLADGVVRDVSLGRVGPTRTGEVRYFTESAGVGLFADALTLYGPKANKNALRAFWAVARVFLSVRAHGLLLTLDGNETVERAVLCEAANTFRIGHAVPIAPGARLTDDVLDIVIAGDLKAGELWPYYRAFRAQLHSALPKIQMRRARLVRIETRRKLSVHCDDQIIGTTPVVIEAVPRALKVLVERL